MQGNIVETLIGAVVLVVAGVFFVYAYRTAGLSASRGYEVVAEFDRVDGLALGADVRLAGIKVGSVSAMRLDPDNFSALVSMDLDPAYRLPEDTSARITSAGLLGQQYISLTPGGAEDALENGSEISVTTGAVDLMGLIGRFIFGSGGQQ